MLVQKIQTNNCYQTNFGSKIKSLRSKKIPYDLQKLDLKDMILKAQDVDDQTFLYAIKALLSDGKKNEYTYSSIWIPNGVCNYADFLRIPEGGGFKQYDLRGDFEESYYMLRDMIVNIARQNNLIPGKPVSLDVIKTVYNQFGRKRRCGASYISYLRRDSVEKKLRSKGFVPNSVITNKQKEAIDALLKNSDICKHPNISFKDVSQVGV